MDGAGAGRRDRLRRYWDRQARSYDRTMCFWDRVLFHDTRRWVCSRAGGRVLEVAVGTGLNLAHYPPEVALTGIDHSPAMLAVATRRAATLGRTPELRIGDAQALDLDDATFDTVVGTFALCAVPDHRRAVAEMVRVLRPGGRLLLADHVVSTSAPVRAGQRLGELVSVPLGGEHFRRRPFDLVTAAGLEVEEHERFALGIVERCAFRRP